MLLEGQESSSFIVPDGYYSADFEYKGKDAKWANFPRIPKFCENGTIKYSDLEFTHPSEAMTYRIPDEYLDKCDHKLLVLALLNDILHEDSATSSFLESNCSLIFCRTHFVQIFTYTRDEKSYQGSVHL